MILRNHYETLGINKGATDEEVRKAYHRLARLYHPDKNEDPKAEDKFKEVGQAYDVMKNKDRREIWEREYSRQQQTLREQKNESNKRRETRSAQETQKTKEKTETKNRKNESKSFFFTDSDYEDETFRRFFEKNEKKRRQSCPPKWNDEWNSRKTDKENAYTFGFNIFMDSSDGFQSFFDPFHMYYDLGERPHRYREFSDDEQERSESFRAERRKKKTKAHDCAGTNGEDDWYDWTRAFQPMASDDDESDVLLICAFCRKQMPIEMLRKHESRCRRFSGSGPAPDILAYQRRQAEIDSDRKRRSSLPQDQRPKSDELITCMYCYRKFNHKVADRHIEFCAKQTMQRGRPMNPLGKSAAARDYSSKNYTAKEYAKTVPKPKAQPRRKSKTQSPEQEPEVDENRNQNDVTSEQAREDGGTTKRSSMNHPTPTRTGLHPTVNKFDPKSRRYSTGSVRAGKPPLIDVNIPPPNSKFTSGANIPEVPGEGCSQCQQQYGVTSSRFACSCGVKKVLPTH